MRQGKDADEISRLKEEFCEGIIKARNQANLSQPRLAELTGVAQPIIARVERSRINPTIITVLKILQPLGKTIKVVDIEKPHK